MWIITIFNQKNLQITISVWSPATSTFHRWNKSQFNQANKIPITEFTTSIWVYHPPARFTAESRRNLLCENALTNQHDIPKRFIPSNPIGSFIYH